MIQSIFLRNFQSHKKTKLYFDSGVNIITGATDSGKTSIIRGIRLVATNRPSGNDVRSNWGGKTEVKLYTDEGVVSRSKDKVEEYILGINRKDEDGADVGDPIVFHAFKTDVPKEISEFLNITDINLQSQLDAPYLLSLTPGVVASHFNKVARLDKIDSATVNINKWVRELSSDAAHFDKDLKAKTEELESFEYLEKYEIELEVLEGMEKMKARMVMADKQLHGILNNIVDVTDKIEKKSEILPIGDLIDTILISVTQKETIKDKQFTLKRLLQSVWDTEHRIELHQKRLKAEKPVNNLLTLISNKNTLANQFTTLNKAVLTVNNTNTLLNTKVAKLAIKSKEFTDNMGDVCLLCNQSLKKGKHTHERTTEL